MLIAQVFPVVSVYTLSGGQYAYRGNIINFPQDMQEFAARLPQDLLSLDLLIVQCYSENRNNFRDFNVRLKKVIQALQWLKANNKLYQDIVIDNEVLQTLPENGSIAEQLPQITDDRPYCSEKGPNDDDDADKHGNENEDPFKSQMFVPSIPNRPSEDRAINEILNRAHDRENSTIEWPHNDVSPVDEFNSPRYIARAFPTLYPWGIGDLNEPRIKEIKPAEYFKHLLVYKNGRFARHRRWRYFALNSLMR
jgi:hypothetical protein